MNQPQTISSGMAILKDNYGKKKVSDQTNNDNAMLEALRKLRGK